MLKLKFSDKPYILDLGMGVKVKVRPCTSAIFFQAKAYMQGILRSINEERAEKKKIGVDFSELLDIETREKREALAERYLTIGLGRAGIISWEGVVEADSNKPAEPTFEKIEELLNNFWVIAENFQRQYTGERELLEAEKKN